MPTKNYTYYSNESVWIHPLAGDASKSRTFNILWGAGTRILSVRLYGAIFAAGGTNARIVFNGEDKMFCDATFGDASVEATVDVTILNGANTILINIWKAPALPVEKIGYFTVMLAVEYEGEIPEVEEPQPWWRIPLYVGLATVTIIAVSSLITAIKR